MDVFSRESGHPLHLNHNDLLKCEEFNRLFMFTQNINILYFVPFIIDLKYKCPILSIINSFFFSFV